MMKTIVKVDHFGSSSLFFSLGHVVFKNHFYLQTKMAVKSEIQMCRLTMNCSSDNHFPGSFITDKTLVTKAGVLFQVQFIKFNFWKYDSSILNQQYSGCTYHSE